MARLSKKTERRIKEQAAHYRRMYYAPCPEVDALTAEIKESAKAQPEGMTKEEEIAYILRRADES